MATDPYLPRLQAKRFELEDIWGKLGLAHNLDAQAPILDQLQMIKKEMIEQGFNARHFREVAYKASLERAMQNRIVPVLPPSKLSPEDLEECLLGLWKAWQERLSYWLGQGKIPSEQSRLLRGSSDPVELPSSRRTPERQLAKKAKSAAQNEATEGPGTAEVKRAMKEIDETEIERLFQGERKEKWLDEAELERLSQGVTGLNEPDSELEDQDSELPDVEMLDTDDLAGKADHTPEMPTLPELTSDGQLQIPPWNGPLVIESAESKLCYNADIELVAAKDPNTRSFIHLSTLLPIPHDTRLQSGCGFWFDSSQLVFTHFVRALKNLGWLKAGQSIWLNAHPLELTWVESTAGQTRLTSENLSNTVWKCFDRPSDHFRGRKDVAFTAAGDELPQFTLIIRDNEDSEVDPDLRKLFEAAEEKDEQAEFIEKELRRNENGFKLLLNAQQRG